MAVSDSTPTLPLRGGLPAAERLRLAVAQRGPEAASDLLDVIAQGSLALRIAALDSLMEVCPDRGEEEALALLEAPGAHVELRAAAARALGASRSPRSFDALIDAVDRLPEGVVNAAGAALRRRRHGHEEAILDAFVLHRRGPRALALVSAVFRNGGRRVRGLFQDLLYSGDRALAAAAAEEVGRGSDPALRELLRDAALRAGPGVRVQTAGIEAWLNDVPPSQVFEALAARLERAPVSLLGLLFATLRYRADVDYRPGKSSVLDPRWAEICQEYLEHPKIGREAALLHQCFTVVEVPAGLTALLGTEPFPFPLMLIGWEAGWSWSEAPGTFQRVEHQHGGLVCAHWRGEGVVVSLRGVLGELVEPFDRMNDAEDPAPLPAPFSDWRQTNGGWMTPADLVAWHDLIAERVPSLPPFAEGLEGLLATAELRELCFARGLPVIDFQPLPDAPPWDELFIDMPSQLHVRAPFGDREIEALERGAEQRGGLRAFVLWANCG